MSLSNAKIRRRLLKYGNLFISQDCQYDDGHENQAVKDMLKNLYEVDLACEALKRKNVRQQKIITI